MTTKQITNLQIPINNLKELNDLASKLASQLKGGEVIDLISDLGGGKTALVRCLMTHLQSLDTVSSPSFTIENIYRCSNFNIHHFDFYRLEEAGICGLELDEAIADPKAVVILEWSNIVKDLLPESRLSIKITPNPIDQAPERRLFEFKTHPDFAYLLKNIE